MSFQTLEGLTVRTRVARVDLMPPGIGEARTARRTRLALGAAVLAVVAACGAASMISAQHVSDAEEQLATEQARTASLRAEQQPYAEVPVVQAELSAARKVSDTVNAYDVAWYDYLDQIAVKSPAGVSFTSLALSVATDPVQATDGTTVDPLAVPSVGTLTVTGQTSSQAQVAAWLDAVATIPGVATPSLGSSALDAANGVVTFNATAPLTDAILQSKQ